MSTSGQPILEAILLYEFYPGGCQQIARESHHFSCEKSYITSLKKGGDYPVFFRDSRVDDFKADFF